MDRVGYPTMTPPVYSTQRTHGLHPVCLPAERIPDYRVEQTHFHYGRSHPVNAHPLTHPQNVQSHRPHPDLPVSPRDHTAPAPLFQPTRRHSDHSQSTPAQIEKAPQPAFDPLIMSATETALAPVRGALDTVWSLAVTNTRLAMNKMNNDFTYLATQERQKNSHLLTKLASLESQLHTALQDVEVLKGERLELQNIIQAYRDENQKLHSEKEHWQTERRLLTGMEGRHGDSGLDMNKVLGAVTEQVSKQVEQKMSAMMDQFDQHRSLRTQPEQTFAETLPHPNHMQFSETSPTVQHYSSPYIPAQSPFPGEPHSPTSTRVVSPVSPHVNSFSNLSGTKQDDEDDASFPTPPLYCPPSPMEILENGPPVFTPAEIQVGNSPVLPQPSPGLIGKSLRRTSSYDQQARKKPRLMDESEYERCTPNLLSSAVITPPDITSNVIEPDMAEEEPVSGSPTVKSEPSEEMGPEMVTEVPKEGIPTTDPLVQPPVEQSPMQHSSMPANQRNTKLGIGHINLLYRTDNGIMTCRMCLTRSRDLLLSRDRSSKVAPVQKYEQEKATWDELISHCRSDHPKTCRDLEKLGPTQIAEMKQRLVSGERLSRV